MIGKAEVVKELLHLMSQEDIFSTFSCSNLVKSAINSCNNATLRHQHLSDRIFKH